MRFVERTGPGQLGLNYMWLPTFIGMNAALVAEVEAKISPILLGRELTEETLDVAHQLVLDTLVQRFPAQSGLFDYLDGIKYVDAHAPKQEES